MTPAGAPAPRAWPALDVIARGRTDGAALDAAPGATAHAPRLALADRLFVLLDDLGPLAVEQDDDGTRWRAFFADAAAREAAAQALRAALEHEIDLEPVEVDDEGWVYKVQEDLRAIHVGRVTVAPPWDTPAVDPADVLLVIEPSMGFGTGHHQSTRLCLLALQQIDLRAKRVVDVGTGSGVLALAAARLGARQVIAFDHDPDSVAAAVENATRNGLAAAVQVRLADLQTAGAEPADVVLANLTAWVLRGQATALASLVAPGGVLVASGFTHEQAPLVEDAFGAFSVRSRLEEDDWMALVLLRSA